MGKKESTLSELDELEAGKKARIRAAGEEIESLRSMRTQILVRMAEDDPAAAVDLKKCDEKITVLKQEIEANELLLMVIPARKDLVRGSNIMSIIPEVEKLDAGIAGLVSEVNKKAAAFMDAVNKLDAHLAKFGELEATKTLPLGLKRFGMSVISHYDFVLSGKAEPGSQIDKAVILGAAVLGKDEFSEWVGNVHTAISKRIKNMDITARRLKGEEVEHEWYYCPHCFENAGYVGSDGKIHCPECGKTS